MSDVQPNGVLRKESHAVFDDVDELPFDILLSHAPVGFSVLTPDFKYRYVNRMLAEQINGKSAKAHIGKTVASIKGKRNWEEIRKNYEIALSGKSLIDVPYTGVVPGSHGKVVHLLSSYYPIRRKGRVIGVGVVVKDITEQQKVKEAYKASEKRLRTLIDQSPLSIQVFSPDGKTLQVNRAWEKLWGAKLSDIAGYNILKDKQLAKFGVLPFIKKGFSGTATQIPAVAYVPADTIEELGDHTPRWVKAFIYPVKDDAGVVQEVVLIHEDISDQKHMEEELKQAKEQFEVILHNIADGISVQDAQGKVVFANDTAARASGFESAKQMCSLGKEQMAEHLSRYELADEDGKPLPFSRLPGRRALAGEPRPELTLQFKDKKTGKVRWAHVKARPIFDVHKNVQYAVNIIADITTERQTREEFKLTKERLEHAQQAGNIGVFDWDLTTQTVWFSQEEKVLFALPESAATIHEWKKRIHPEDRDLVLKQMRQAIRKNTAYESEFRIIHPNNTTHWIKGKAHPYYQDGKAIRMIGVHYDVTKRKHLEQSLQFKAQASKILSSSLDYTTTLNTVANLAIRYIADWCAVDLLQEDGTLKNIAIAHKDPKKVSWAKRYREKYVDVVVTPGGIGKVLATGKPVFYPTLTAAMLKASPQDKRYLPLLKEIGFLSSMSIMIVPLKLQKKTIGTITFIENDPNRTYTDTDLLTAEQLATRASMAIENARLYDIVANEQHRLTDILANVPGVVWEAWGKPDDRRQRIDFVSEHVEKLLGYSVDEWIQKPNFWLSIVHPEDKERAAAEAAQIFASRGTGISRFRWIGKDGRVVWVESQSQVVVDENGKAVGMRGVAMDISERMEIEKRKDEFISMASHELKTPVTSLKVYTQLLERQFEREGKKDSVVSVSKMNAQIGKLTNLINDLLNLSKIQAGKLEFRKSEFDLNTLVEEVVTTLQATDDTHQIIVRGKLAELVYGDRDRISQVLINLLTNAMKYSQGADTVILTVSSQKQHVVVSVQDFGIGIEKKHQEKIFDRFYQVTDPTEKTFPGLGIGLYISNQIIQRHGGTIHVDSAKGKGSTFTFTLPLSHKNNVAKPHRTVVSRKAL